MRTLGVDFGIMYRLASHRDIPNLYLLPTTTITILFVLPLASLQSLPTVDPSPSDYHRRINRSMNALSHVKTVFIQGTH